MYSLAVFSLAVAAAVAMPYHGEQAKPVVLPSGHLADTHEVAAAKSAHLGALHGAASSGAGHYDAGHSGAAAHGADIKYHGPQAIPKVLPDGHIADTHEVSAAKHAHLEAVAEAKTHGHSSGHHADDGSYHDGSSASYHAADSHHGASHGAYHGPLAKPVVLPSGHLADTHEVAAAKGAHLEALAAKSHH